MVTRQNAKDGGLPATVQRRIDRKRYFRRGVGYLVPSVVLATVLTGGCSKTHTTSVLGDAAHPTPVHFYTVAEETARRRIQAVGSLYAFEESTLSSQVEGRVAEVLADVGDNVKAGQALIALDPQELQFEVDRQRGFVTQVRAQLGIGPNDPPPTDPKKIASVQRAEADLFDADRKYSRAQQMYKDNLISQQQLDEAASRFQSTKATYTVALQEVDRLKALLISSEASERLSEKKLADAAIRAPFPGAIKARNVHPGEYVKVQSPVMVLVRTDHLRARLAVAERWAGWVRDGATVDLHVEAFPGETFQGKISRINPAVEQDSRTFEAEALLVNLDGRLKPGFFLQASIPSEKEEKTIFLPERAVNYRYGVYKVFLLNGNRVSEHQIRPAGQTEDEHGRRFEVAEGLKPGDKVAVAISGDLRDGSIVREQPEGTAPAAK
ncbi:MAG TPA: efflux RND transporter periplasmic adaptor subunit [Candidatus Polarisedimenticolia bacterium]|nr:efflux RND transporter periplasmic adaptor subunit [Candidatus Polarisedimenticolia bacterium]